MLQKSHNNVDQKLTNCYNTTMNNILERPSMVLLIDCWAQWDKPTDSNVQECLNNIKNFCWQNPYVCSIGLASYTGGMDSATVSAEEPWHHNAKELFYNTTRWEHLRQTWDSTCFDSDSHTHRIIRDLNVRPDQTQFAVWHTSQLLYYCNHVYPSIENIYVFGIAWDVCVESRPIGWKELNCLNQYNMFTAKKTILSDITCTLDCNKNFVTQVAAPWKMLYNNVAILN
jgi:hypothetical protein